LKHRVLNCE